LPEFLRIEHGGFYKARLALVPPLLLLTCFREPAVPVGAWLWRGGVVLVLLTNLVLVTQRVEVDNRDIAEYTAARDIVGTGRILFVVQPMTQPDHNRNREIANPLLHASQYYCLGTGNLNLDNYQATTHHFPLRFRDGVTRGRDAFAGFSHQQDVDVILTWQTGHRLRLPSTYLSVFRQGRLEVFARKQEPVE
jgi:hypothetical protein